MAFFKNLKSKISDVTNRLGGGLSSLFSGRDIDENFWEELEDLLIAGDVGVDLTDSLIDSLRVTVEEEHVHTSEELLEKFRDQITQRLEAVPDMGVPVSFPSGLKAIVMVGVNGSGKTTSSGKLAYMFSQQGKKVVLAAADTFRAAAVEQLKVWGERAGIRVIAQKQGSDSGAVAFDAINAAKASGADVVIIDTAGRLQAKHNLMEELGKIYRIITKELGPGQVESLLVLDAVMGQNSFRQAEVFNEVAPLTGIVLAKYDNTAKGGIVLAIADKLNLPIRYVGTGESIDDMGPFNPQEFVQSLLKKKTEQNEEVI